MAKSAGISPMEAQLVILRNFPHAHIKIEDNGIVPGYEISTVHRYSVDTELLGAKVCVKLELNMSLVIDEVPRAVFRNVGQSPSAQAQEALSAWMRSLGEFLLEKELPQVEAIATRYFGEKESHSLKKNGLFIYYDAFYIVITPSIGFVFSKKNGRMAYHGPIETLGQIEEFFRSANFYAVGLRSGQIH